MCTKKWAHDSHEVSVTRAYAEVLAEHPPVLVYGCICACARVLADLPILSRSVPLKQYPEWPSATPRTLMKNQRKTKWKCARVINSPVKNGMYAFGLYTNGVTDIVLHACARAHKAYTFKRQQPI